MQVIEIIAKKRDGGALTAEEIRFFIDRYVDGEIADYQAAAFLMAVCLRGMTDDEAFALTRAMLHSGAIVDWAAGSRCVDKHSTGGVGDKTSLVLAPVVAAAGVPVPMISGRSLAHSGGTLDKLESIPGFRTDLSLDEFRRTVERVGAALIGQTAEIAPADKKLYALRDVTATVPCRPLMAASILSKKLAEGISGLVLDVKAGSGAFMKTAGEARALAELLAGIVSAMNKKCVGLITDMSQPLGNAVGNSVEVIEAFDTLRGEGPEDFTALCRELSAHMLVLGGAAGDLDTGRRIYDRLIESGDALEKMREIIAEQQGDVRVLDDSARLPRARSTSDVISRSAGFVASINTETIGWAAMSLGAGRVRLDSEIDHSVGLILRKKVGDRVSHSESLATIHYNESGREAEAARAVESAYEIESDRRSPPPLIYEVID